MVELAFCLEKFQDFLGILHLVVVDKNLFICDTLQVMERWLVFIFWQKNFGQLFEEANKHCWKWNALHHKHYYRQETTICNCGKFPCTGMLFWFFWGSSSKQTDMSYFHIVPFFVRKRSKIQTEEMFFCRQWDPVWLVVIWNFVINHVSASNQASNFA